MSSKKTKSTRFEKQCTLSVPAEVAFAWHRRPRALERLLPPWERTALLTPGTGINIGDQVVLDAAAGPFHRQWVARHDQYEEDRKFRDVQVKGPFRRWEHTHRFIPKPHGSVLRDEIDYVLPGGWLGRRLLGSRIRRLLENTFTYRHRILQDDLAIHDQFRNSPRKRLAVVGDDSPLLRQLTPFLEARHRVASVSARNARDHSVMQLMRGCDALVTLIDPTDAPHNTQRTLFDRALLLRHLGTSVARYRGTTGQVIVIVPAATEERARQILDLAHMALAPARRAGVHVTVLCLGTLLTPLVNPLRHLVDLRRAGLRPHITDDAPFPWTTIDEVLDATLYALESEFHGTLTVAHRPVDLTTVWRVLEEMPLPPHLMPVMVWAARWKLARRVSGSEWTAFAETGVAVAELGYRVRYAGLADALHAMLGVSRERTVVSLPLETRCRACCRGNGS